MSMPRTTFDEAIARTSHPSGAINRRRCVASPARASRLDLDELVRSPSLCACVVLCSSLVSEQRQARAVAGRHSRARRQFRAAASARFWALHGRIDPTVPTTVSPSASKQEEVRISSWVYGLAPVYRKAQELDRAAAGGGGRRFVAPAGFSHAAGEGDAEWRCGSVGVTCGTRALECGWRAHVLRAKEGRRGRRA